MGTCECGHREDEHDKQGGCLVDDCRCFYYEWNGEED